MKGGCRGVAEAGAEVKSTCSDRPISNWRTKEPTNPTRARLGQTTIQASRNPRALCSPRHPSSLHLSKAKISKRAPDWEATAVINGEFKQLRLSDYKGRYLVLLFYPLDFTFVCPTEVKAFSERVQQFREIGVEVVACSVDSHFSHLAWINLSRKQGGLGPMNIPLLSDLTHQIAKDYGVYLEDLGHSLRGLFIIDGRGVLRQVTLNDLPVGRSVDETLRLVQALQHTDRHGAVCPAGWKPGDDTINPEEALRARWPKQEL
ncbi:peroxiredoxin-2-like isoform X2 [Hypomesus transpacificus]|uniref:peroxiredoxin-2-like isoform X2 n=1 Tax=Hypomesus transpacificus TaxID=137520 RepID=UPI001F08152F|nr:peroxiredoxin-2-like isoform X2 [Hypomesus transpacificus]